VARFNLEWESKLVLLLVVPYCAVSVVLQARTWAGNAPEVATWALGLSLLLGLVAWKMRTATPAASATGALLTASLIFSTLVFPYRPWETGLIPVLTVLVLTGLATRFGRPFKERLGTAEKRQGRGAAQVAANVGLAALVMDPTIQSMLAQFKLASGGASGREGSSLPLLAVGLAALAEAAADTVSSELGQVMGGVPRMLTTFRRVEPGTDGGITLVGTAAGAVAAAIVALTGSLALHGGLWMFTVSWAAGVFGLLFDSLLGATLERAGWLNNDAVNFLSTASAAALALGLAVFAPHLLR
jgi:uncharacterized protein (TIGR00297 family)